LSVTKIEDTAVGRDQPITATIGGAGHADNGSLFIEPAGRSDRLVTSEGVGAPGPISMAGTIQITLVPSRPETARSWVVLNIESGHSLWKWLLARAAVL
jgi:hypothetical protein